MAETLEACNYVPAQYIAVFFDETLVAVIPVRFHRLEIGSLALKVLQLVSDQEDSHTARDIVVEPALTGTDFLQQIIMFLAENDPHWDAILFEDILEDSLAAAALQHAPRLPCLQTPGGVHGRMDFLSCGMQDGLFQRLSKGFKQNLRTAHNKIKSENLAFQIAQTESSLTAFLPDFLKVESSGWKGELGSSALLHYPTQTFLRLLIGYFGPKSGCQIHIMRVGEHPISSLFGIVTDRTWFIVKTGYDESYQRLSPGHLIIENLLKQNAATGEFSLLTTYSAVPWFYAWKPDRTQKVYNKWIFRPDQHGLEMSKKIAALIQSGGVLYPGAPKSAAPLKWLPL